MKRNASLDIIRSLAIFLVLCKHSVINGKFTAEPITGVSGYIMMGVWLVTSVCVPLFLMLSGYLLNRKKPTVKYYVNYLHIFIPYVLISIITQIFRMEYLHVEMTVRSFVGDIANFSGCLYAWYLMMYTGLYLLIPFLNAMYHSLETKRQKLLLIFSFFALSHLPSIVDSYINIYSVWWKNLYPVTFYLLGAYCSEYPPAKKPSLYFKWLAGLLVVFSMYDVFYLHGDGSSATYYGYENYQVLLVCFLIFRGISSLDIKKLPSGFLKCTETVSKLSFYIYLLSGITDDILYPIVAANVADYYLNYGYFILTAIISFTAAFFVVCSALSYRRMAVKALHRPCEQPDRQAYETESSGKLTAAHEV